MAIEVIMPQAGENIESGTVVRWLKDEGDPVKKGEVICEVETEKAVFEVEAREDGFLRMIVVPEGAEAPILSVLGIIGTLEEVISLDGRSPETRPEAQKERRPELSNSQVGGDETQARGEKMTRISPRAKKLAREKGVPIQQIEGSGHKGRIIENDVLDFIEGKPEKTHISTKGQVIGSRVVPMTKARKATAQRMQQSKQVIPHFYVTVSVDMTEALKFRAEFNEGLDKGDEESLSVTDLISRACVLGLKEFPELNSSLVDEDNIVIWEDINIGIAVALDTGLVVPVLENADRLTLRQIARQTRRLVAMARDGRQGSLAPGRFTISNLGMFNVDNFIAIINSPEIAILAVASIEKRAVAIDGNLVGLREVMNITLSVDHRVADGVIASRFLNKVKALLEDTSQLL